VYILYLYRVKEMQNIPSETVVTLTQKEYDRLLGIEQEFQFLKQQFEQLQRALFGRKSERFVGNNDPAQLSLFGENTEETSTPETEEISYSRTKKDTNKKRPVRTVLPAHLPRVEEIINPEVLEEGSVKIGEEITEILEYTPAQLFVRKIIRPKYVFPKAETEGIIVAPLPSLPIPKGNAGASFLAHIMVSKFIDHLPFYRQIQIYKRQDFTLSDSTINGWFNATAELLAPLYDTLKKEILMCDYLQADESPIGVQSSHKKGALHTGYQWVYRSPERRQVLFKYHKGRGREAPEEILENFWGALQTDGYIAYKTMKTNGEINLLACMAHARRYFEKALDNDAIRAKFVLNEIQHLYKMERKAKEREVNDQTLKRYRQLYALPILDKLETWLNKNKSQVLPKSAIGKAISYTLNLWTRLIGYIENGKYEIDNNMIENAIRPLALGRKNYMFAGSHKAAQQAAMMYSFFATCKTNNINPLQWLTDVLNRIQEHKANKLSQLLPNNWEKV
jgi:transposase